MSALRALRVAALAATWIALSVPASRAQPSLGSLWPHVDQATWRYEFSFESVIDPPFTAPATLHFNGTVQHYGNTLQVLEDALELPPGVVTDVPPLPPLIRDIWRVRPDLREALEERYALPRGTVDWRMVLLQGGYFQETPDAFHMWQPSFDHPTWTYVQLPLAVGASFTQQLLPELTDDTFLHGTVEALDQTVVTPAGTYPDAVRMAYVIDYGVSVLTDTTGVLLGTSHAETVGHVDYVPGVGPVALFEELFPYAWADCGESGCPPEVQDLVGVAAYTYSLTLTEAPTAVERVSWGATKAAFR